MYIINHAGRFVEVPEELGQKMIRFDDARLANSKEIKEFSATNLPATSSESIYFQSPEGRPDGYGMSQENLIKALRSRGINLSKKAENQKIGILYSYPYGLASMTNEIKVLVSMFESTKIPREWVEYTKLADKIFVPSKFCQNAFKAQDVETEVIPLGYDPEAFYYVEKEDHPVFRFLHYNAFDNRKGWDLVFKAFTEEFKQDKSVELILKTIRPEIPFPIPKSEYPNITIIKKEYTTDDLRELIASSDCFVFPSRGEGFGLTPLEALAVGTPVIIPNASGMSEYFDEKYFHEVKVKSHRPAFYQRFKNQDVGDFVEVDLRDLRRQMRYVYENKKEVYHRAELGAKWVKQHFTINHTAEKFETALKALQGDSSATKKDKDITEPIIFLSEDTRHITGGRYYSWWLATALTEAGHRVAIYTNKMPVFIREFKKYKQPEICLVDDLKDVDVPGKMYIGSPIIGSEMACKLGEKYNKPYFSEIFDPFPMMEKYRGNHHWPGWENLIPLLKNKNCNIISLCKTTNPWIRDWLGKTPSQVFEIYPCINSREKKDSKTLPKKKWVTFISRLDHHKKLDHVLEAVKATDCELHVITSIDGINFPEMVKEHGMESRVVIHKFATDEEKFEIIKQSKATINGAIFEGFGMWLAESLSCGVPAVCYEYPTFKEITRVANAENMVYFAEYDKPESLKEQLQNALKMRKGQSSRAFDFDKMVGRINKVVGLKPKIGVVMIALNEEEYIGASLKSVLKQESVSKIAVVEGCVNLYGAENPDRVNDEGLSVDKTKKEIMKVINSDEHGKIVYQQYGWAADKSELRNRCLELLGGDCDYIMVVDADEVWKTKDFDRLIDHISANPDVTVVWYPAYHFWKRPGTLAIGSQWDKHLFRFFKDCDESLHWENHASPVVNSEGKSVTEIGISSILNDVHFYHYGAMKSEENIRGKLKFYKARDKNLKVKDTWSKWKKGDETQWTHGEGTTKEFKGSHPREVVNIIKKYK